MIATVYILQNFDTQLVKSILPYRGLLGCGQLVIVVFDPNITYLKNCELEDSTILGKGGFFFLVSRTRKVVSRNKVCVLWKHKAFEIPKKKIIRNFVMEEFENYSNGMLQPSSRLGKWL